MNILYTCSDKYAPHCGISILSLIKNNQKEEKIHFYVIDGGISQKNKQNMEFVCNTHNRQLTFLDVQHEFAKILHFFPSNIWSYISLVRVFPEHFFPNIDRVLALGADTVIHDSIHDFYYADMADYVLGGIPSPEFFNGTLYEIPDILNKNPYYFNADVLLFNMDNWRSRNYEEKMLKMLPKIQKKLLLGDQSALNYTVDSKDLVAFPCRYNYWGHRYSPKIRYRMLAGKHFTVEDVQQAHEHPAIIHYLGKYERPWIENTLCDQQYSDIYNFYKNQSPWRGECLDNLYSLNPFSHLPFSKRLLNLYIYMKRNGPFVYQRFYGSMIRLKSYLKPPGGK